MAVLMVPVPPIINTFMEGLLSFLGSNIEFIIQHSGVCVI